MKVLGVCVCVCVQYFSATLKQIACTHVELVEMEAITAEAIAVEMEAITAEAIAKAVEVVLRRMDFTPENTIG
jgi:Cu2+-containing amine oxidase